MSSFTKGPWKVGGSRIGAGDKSVVGLWLEREDGARLAEFFSNCGVDESTLHANAKLAATAPELLAALTDVLGWIPSSGWHTAEPLIAVERARAVIAKASAP